MQGKILFLDDRWKEESWKESIQERLPEGLELIFEDQGHKALQRLNANRDIKLVFLDLHFEGQPKQGVDILEEIKEHYPELPVIILTSSNDVQLALRLVVDQKKAYYYFFKNEIDYDQFVKTIENAIGYYELKEDSIRKTDIGYIVGESPGIQEVLRLTEKASQTGSTVLITGETGTGKELIARSIHMNSGRKAKLFVVVNCAALPYNLVESELFGHVKGAFTGADRDREGLFEKANGGTIFLDEIGELKPEIQAKLLRVLQFGEVEKVGSSKLPKVNVRVIAATNRDLEKNLEERTFREDLYYRLQVLRVHIPPLRERRADIPLLVNHILDKLNSKQHMMKRTSEDALEFLQQYHWPGNIRQLENILEAAMTVSNSDVLIRTNFSSLITPKDPSTAEDSIVSQQGKKLLKGEIGWKEIEQEFGPQGEIRRAIIDRTFKEYKDQNGKRLSGKEFANLLKVTETNARQILHSVGRRLKDYG